MALTFDEVTEANIVRGSKWHKGNLNSWSLSDWGVALGGEVGELLNVVKKLNRVRDNILGNRESEEELKDMLRSEVADVFHYLDLFCIAAGIDLPEAIVNKFNKVSGRHGFPDRLTLS